MDHSIPQTKHGISLSPINQKPFMQEIQGNRTILLSIIAENGHKNAC
jgi:hypothetical protein